VRYAFILVTLLLISCKKQSINYTQVILDNEIINTSFFESVDEPERALLSWYLYAYGNECTSESDKYKCKLLNLLKIEDECSKEHISYLNDWFFGNILIQAKLYNCPSLPFKFAIQNTIKKIILSRASDTLSITFKVKGMNTMQEKFWNIEQKEFFLIRKNTLTKINK